MPLGLICTIEHPIILPQKVDVRIEWGHVRNVLITMSGTKWPSSKHHLFLHSLKGLSTYMMFLSLSWVAVIISWATVTSGKDILSEQFSLLLWACCLFLFHWALLLHSWVMEMLWNLFPLWFLGGWNLGLLVAALHGNPSFLSSVLPRLSAKQCVWHLLSLHPTSCLRDLAIPRGFGLTWNPVATQFGITKQMAPFSILGNWRKLHLNIYQ